MFQSTHPRGVRPDGTVQQGDGYVVSIHAPAWGATRSAPGKRTGETRFNPRTRVGCDSGDIFVSVLTHSFNPRTRVGCDRVVPGSPALGVCFNPRTRVGCDVFIEDVVVGAEGVSIHAPAWGATRYDSRSERWQESVSIHAPAWGATFFLGSKPCSRNSFNPRTRVGCDSGPWNNHHQRCGFNPRTRVGCDIIWVCLLVSPILFQSTHPRGVRPTYTARPRKLFEFQSTHPRGVRPHTRMLTLVPVRVSIHAPAWGATCWTVYIRLCCRCFNPRTRVGCDGDGGDDLLHGGQVSIHAPAWGATC